MEFTLNFGDFQFSPQYNWEWNQIKKKIKGIRTKFSNRLLELNHGIFLIYETIFFRIAHGLVYLVVFKPSQIYVGF